MIRSMSAADVVQVVAIERNAHDPPWSEENFLSELQNVCAHSLVAYDEHRILGYLVFWMIEAEVHLLNLTVHPESIGGTPANRPPFADAGGLLLAGIEGDMVHWDGREGRMKTTLSKPKKFGPLRLPSVSETQTWAEGRLEETMREESVSIEWNPDVPEDAFRMPDSGFTFLKPGTKESQAFQGLMLLHTGPYDRMGDTINTLMAACREAQFMTMGAIATIHLNSPQEVEDPSELRTEVIAPVTPMGPAPKDTAQML